MKRKPTLGLLALALLVSAGARADDINQADTAHVGNLGNDARLTNTGRPPDHYATADLLSHHLAKFMFEFGRCHVSFSCKPCLFRVSQLRSC